MQFGPGFLPTFLYYFTSTAVIFALVASQALGISLQSTVPQQIGAVGGLVAGLLGAALNRTVALTVPVQNQQALLGELNQALALMGYRQQAALENNVLVYERSGLSRFLSGKVFVQLEAETVTIASRAIQVKAIRRRVADKIPKLS